ncbi:MAG TPA: 3-deoxy-7-phosphoheptulonate synthase [Thermomicrobiaceae bacterium]|nr:3-deoxy-7-phosphoheptulonate synthase [Thermomicrobiaceae bacterium]
MIIRMQEDAGEGAAEAVVAELAGRGYETHLIRGGGAAAIGVNGRPLADGLGSTLALAPGVAEVVIDSTPYKLAARAARPQGTLVRVGAVTIGRDGPVMVAGPCAVESREQTLRTAKAVAGAGAVMLRGGAYKPRSSPYSFQGLGEAGLRILAEARTQTGLPVVTEVMEPDQVELVAEYADMLQIGSRNMMNVPLLRRAALSGKPILLKRGFAATIEEWLLAAEYILAGGNDQVVLCERGIRSFDSATRFTLDLNAVPLLRQLTHLPILVDPSHGTGRRELVPAMSLAAVAAGAHGLMLEVHHAPEDALCDGPQSITSATLEDIVQRAAALHALLSPPLCVA